MSVNVSSGDRDGATLRNAVSSGMQRLAHTLTGRRDAELLLMHLLGRDRAFLLTHPEYTLSGPQLALYLALVDRRGRREPMQYIVGEQEFFGLSFEVTPDVLIPRPETEHLVEAVLTFLPHDRPVRIVDVGTGSGAIAVALAHSLPLARVTGLDISTAALAVARRNAQKHGVAERIDFMESDLLASMQAAAPFDAMVSNPPYIADHEPLESQVRDYEPHRALFAGPTGLEVYERLVPQAAKALKPRGWLLMEIGMDQKCALQHLLSGWSDVRFEADLQGIPRVAIARLA